MTEIRSVIEDVVGKMTLKCAVLLAGPLLKTLLRLA